MVMSPSIRQRRAPVRVPESGGSPLVGIRGLEAGLQFADRDGRFLTKHWEPLGGILELGETIRDGLRREVARRPASTLSPSVCPTSARTGHPTSERRTMHARNA